MFPRKGNVILSFTWILTQQIQLFLFLTCTCLQLCVVPAIYCSVLMITMNGTQTRSKGGNILLERFFHSLYIVCECGCRVGYRSNDKYSFLNSNTEIYSCLIRLLPYLGNHPVVLQWILWKKEEAKKWKQDRCAKSETTLQFWVYYSDTTINQSSRCFINEDKTYISFLL